MKDDRLISKMSKQAHKNKFISFFIDNEEYGVVIHKVKEIIKMMHITPVPNSPFYIKGIINLRGKVIPVIELRLKFGIDFREYDAETNIIVVEVDTGEKNILIGAIVDSVSDILQLDDKDIEEAPSFGVEVNTDAMLGVGIVEGDAKILLDIDKILTSEEVTVISNLHSKHDQTSNINTEED